MSTRKKDNFAYPGALVDIEDDGMRFSEPYKTYSKGLTKREYFAAMAMQGMMSCGVHNNGYDGREIAKDAVEFADALIKELEKDA